MTDRPKGVSTEICTVDLLKRDSEIRLPVGRTEEKTALILRTLNNTGYTKGILIRRQESP